jgi:hypothetical protein
MPAVAADIMTRVWQRIKGSRSQEYHLLPVDEKEPVSRNKYKKKGPTTLRCLGFAFAISATLLSIYGLIR